MKHLHKRILSVLSASALTVCSVPLTAADAAAFTPTVVNAVQIPAPSVKSPISVKSKVIISGYGWSKIGSTYYADENIE